MSTAEWLQVGLGVLLLVIVFQLSSLITLIRNIAIGFSGDLYPVIEKAQDQRRDIASNIETLGHSLSHISSVMRVIEKYMLPDKEEQLRRDIVRIERKR